MLINFDYFYYYSLLDWVWRIFQFFYSSILLSHAVNSTSNFLQNTRKEFAILILSRSAGNYMYLYDQINIIAISYYFPSLRLFFDVLGCIYKIDSSRIWLTPNIELLIQLKSTHPAEFILYQPYCRLITFWHSSRQRYSSSAYLLFKPICTKL